MKGPLEAVIEDMQRCIQHNEHEKVFVPEIESWVKRLLPLCKADPQKTRVINLKGELMAEFPDRLRMSPDQTAVYLGQTPYEVVSTSSHGTVMTVQVKS